MEGGARLTGSLEIGLVAVLGLGDQTRLCAYLACAPGVGQARENAVGKFASRGAGQKRRAVVQDLRMREETRCHDRPA